MSHNEVNIVHKMGIFTSVTLSADLAPHETDRQVGTETRGRDGEGEGQTQCMAVCDRLCLHEAVCDACIMFECVSLFLCTVYVPELGVCF